MNNLTAEKREKIGRFIGRDVLESEEGCINSFEDFSEFDENEFRLLYKDRILAIAYIRYRLHGEVGLNVVMSYHARVIEQGIPFGKWNISRD